MALILTTGKVDETGQKNTVLTLYELTESEATLSQGDHFLSDVGGALLC